MLKSASPRITKRRCHARLAHGSDIHRLAGVSTSFPKGTGYGMVAGRPTQPAFAAIVLSDTSNPLMNPITPKFHPGGPSPDAAGFPCWNVANVSPCLARSTGAHRQGEHRRVPSTVTATPASNGRFPLRTALPERPSRRAGAPKPPLPKPRQIPASDPDTRGLHAAAPLPRKGLTTSGPYAPLVRNQTNLHQPFFTDNIYLQTECQQPILADPRGLVRLTRCVSTL